MSRPAVRFRTKIRDFKRVPSVKTRGSAAFKVSAMTQDQRQHELLDKAKDADERAVKATDSQVKDTWRAIAQNYRELALTTSGKLTRKPRRRKHGGYSAETRGGAIPARPC